MVSSKKAKADDIELNIQAGEKPEDTALSQTDTPTAEEVAAAFEAAVLGDGAFGDAVSVEATTIDAGELAGVMETPVRRVPHGAEPVVPTGLEETIISSSPQWQGQFLTVDDVVVQLPNGRRAHHDVIRHPGAVAIIALTDNNKLVMVHQYRTTLEQVTLEIPAGKLELGEDPAEAAARELVEETGYVADQLAYLGPIAVAAGYSDEILHLYMAMGLTFVGAHPDDDEFVNVDLVDLDKAIDQVLDGKIIDSKTVAGILLCDAILRRM